MDMAASKGKFALFFLTLALLVLAGCQQKKPGQVGQAISLCGNGVLDNEEHCEAGDLQGFSCTDFGLTGGGLSCKECRFEVSGCTSPASLEFDDENKPSPATCSSSSGLSGITGPNVFPKIDYEWQWNEYAAGQCFFSSQSQAFEPQVRFCDSTQFTIYLLYNINDMIESGENEKIFFGALMADGFTSDFREDFYHYYKNIAFFDAPSFFHESLSGLLIDEQRLIFSQQYLDKPGIYKITLVKESSEAGVENSLGRWTIKLDFVFPPVVESAFYYMPVDGLVGFDLRQGELMANRRGYGTGFSGDPLVLGDTLIDKEITSTLNNLVVDKQASFFKANVEKRGELIELDLENGVLGIYDTTPSVSVVDFSSLDEKARNLGAPFFVTLPSGEILPTQGNYLEWRFLYSKNQCPNEKNNIFVESIKDSRLQDNSCAKSQGDTLFYPNAISEFAGSSAVLGAIVYSDAEYSLLGACGTVFETREIEGNRPRDIVYIRKSTPLQESSDISFSKIENGDACIHEGDNKKKSVVFWNEEKLLTSFPACTDCQCVNIELVSKITGTGIKPTPVYAGSSVSFWVQFEEKSPVSQPDIGLFVVYPADGSEEKQEIVFFDDGRNNDFGYNDNVFGGTLRNGFSQEGTYRYYFKAKDAYGNDISSETKNLEVIARPECEISHFGGNVNDKLNIFVVGDNWGDNSSYYLALAENMKEDFLATLPASDYKSAYNIITVSSYDGIGCTSETIQPEFEDFESQAIRCNDLKVISSASSCGLPFKEKQRPFGDKIVVLHSGDFRSNASLSGQISRVSTNASSTTDAKTSKPSYQAKEVGLQTAGNISVHELGHNFGLLDLYPSFVTEALGDSCTNVDEANCIMCQNWSSRFAYDCTTSFRATCNLSIDHEQAHPAFGRCADDQKEMNDYEYMVYFFSRLEAS